MVAAVGAVVGDAVFTTGFFDVPVTSRTTSAMTSTSATAPTAPPQRWFRVQLLGCRQFGLFVDPSPVALDPLALDPPALDPLALDPRGRRRR
jgi:hypothetical protein